MHGRGVIRGVAAGTARIRVVYADPAYKRGFADEVTLPVKDVLSQARLDSIRTSFPKLTIVAGDSFSLPATAAYTRGEEHFHRDCTGAANWSSAASDRVQVAGGIIKAIRAGEPVVVTASYQGKSATTEVAVVSAPVIHRICFQVQDTPPRTGWKAESGQRYRDARGYGWLNIEGLATRDDRASAKHPLRMRFNTVKEKEFKIDVPPGQYAVRISMGDADYGAVPFDDWTALGTEKLIYYQGHGNNSADKIVAAGDHGLTFTVNGPINYLIVAPVGIDLNKYANDGPTDNGK